MRWVFASLLAGLITVVLFFGIMRFVENNEEKGSLAFERAYRTDFAVQPLTPIGHTIGCGYTGLNDTRFERLPKPDTSLKEAMLDEAKVALLNSSSRVDIERISFELPSLKQSKLERIEKVSACIVHHSPCDGHPTPEVQYPRTGTTARLPDTDCDVSFAVGVDGVPRDIEVACGHSAFESVSREAISQLQYVTEDKCGPCERSERRVTYPLRFRYE